MRETIADLIRKNAGQAADNTETVREIHKPTVAEIEQAFDEWAEQATEKLKAAGR